MRKKAATDLPPEFGISARVKKWAGANGFDKLETHLEYFLMKVEAHGYQYCNWDAAFMTAIRDDWAKLRQPKKINGYGADIVKAGTERGLPPKVGESMEEYQRRILQARH